MWPNILALAVDPLALEFGHPSTALFSLAWEEIGIEHGKIAAIAVEYLVSLNVGMINWDVVIGFKGYAIEAIGQTKHAVYHLR